MGLRELFIKRRESGPRKKVLKKPSDILKSSKNLPKPGSKISSPVKSKDTSPGQSTSQHRIDYEKTLSNEKRFKDKHTERVLYQDGKASKYFVKPSIDSPKNTNFKKDFVGTRAPMSSTEKSSLRDRVNSASRFEKATLKKQELLNARPRNGDKSSLLSKVSSVTQGVKNAMQRNNNNTLALQYQQNVNGAMSPNSAFSLSVNTPLQLPSYAIPGVSTPFAPPTYGAPSYGNSTKSNSLPAKYSQTTAQPDTKTVVPNEPKRQSSFRHDKGNS